MNIQKLHAGRLSVRSSLLFAVAGFALAAPAQIPMAWEQFSLAGRFDVYGIGQYLHSDDVTFNGPLGDVKVRMADTGMGGFGVAFHFNDALALHGDFMFGDANFSGDYPVGTGATAHVSRDAFIQTGRLNLDYYMIKRRLTPFVTAGIGYQYLDADLENLPPEGVNWWWQDRRSRFHKEETDLTGNVGAGIRWSITDQLFIRLTGGAKWLEYRGANGVTTQIEGIFAIGWMF
jgi:opacity protein-like surface antigen